jgi:hypothetical protein
MNGEIRAEIFDVEILGPFSFRWPESEEHTRAIGHIGSRRKVTLTPFAQGPAGMSYVAAERVHTWPRSLREPHRRAADASSGSWISSYRRMSPPRPQGCERSAQVVDLTILACTEKGPSARTG